MPDSIDDFARNESPLFKKPNPAAFHRTGELAMPAQDSAGAVQSRALKEKNRQIEALERQLADLQQQNQRLLALNQFGQELESSPNPERTARSMAKLLHKLFESALIGIYNFQPGDMRFKLVAAAGSRAQTLPGSLPYDAGHPVLNQAIQARQMVASSRLTGSSSSPALFGNAYRSLLAAPLASKNELYGLILLADGDSGVLRPDNYSFIETAAARLSAAWEYARRGETLAGFIQSISSFANVQETGSLMERIASVARSTMNASFAVVAKRNQQGWLLRSAGKAPLLLHSLTTSAAHFLEEAIKAPYTFRLQDLRKDPRSVKIELDASHLRSLLACPIQSNGQNTGLILVFGKQNGNGFLDGDVFLAELLAANAAMNLESCFLNQELRKNLETTQLLYGLSLDISLAENLHQALHVIAETALKLMQAQSCGLVLTGKDGQKESAVIFPNDQPEAFHPYGLIRQAIESQQIIYLAENEQMIRLAIPIRTSRRCYGALWMDILEEVAENHHPAEEIRVLVNQASVALERLIFLEETRSQAKKLEAIYLQLEETYHQTLMALMRALDARDSEVEGHSERVNELANQLGKAMGLSDEQQKALMFGALLHDIGKIGVPDHILHKKGPLDPAEWEAMRKHPENGVQIIRDIHYLKEAIPVVYFHQERWNGSGYPQARAGEQIPLLARIFAVVDVFDALTRDRPYRKANYSTEQALAYLEEQAGILFDPLVVERFASMVRYAGQQA